MQIISRRVAHPASGRAALALVTSIVLLTTMGAGVAAAAWTAPATLSPNDRSSNRPGVAVTPAGDAVVVWDHLEPDFRSDRIQTRTRHANGTLSATQNLSSAAFDGDSAQVAVDDAGAAYFVWQQSIADPDDPVSSSDIDYRVQGRVRSPGGTLGPILNVSAISEHTVRPQVAVNPAGDAAFAWQSFSQAASDWRVYVRAMPAGGALGPIQLLATGVDEAPTPSLDVADDGDAVVAWHASDAAYVRERRADGTLTARQTVSELGTPVGAIEVAAAPDGRSLIAWTSGPSHDRNAEARARSAAGALSPIQLLSDPAGRASEVHVGVSDGGLAVFAWRFEIGGDPLVQTRARSAGGTLSATRQVSPIDAASYEPQIAVDSNGTATYAWKRWDPDNFAYRVQLRTRAPNGALGVTTTRSTPEETAQGPQVGVNAAGAAVAVWPQEMPFTGCDCFRIQASAGP